MKKSIFVSIAMAFGLLIIGFGAVSIFLPSTAQKKYAVQWEYAAINFTTNPFYAENQAVITGITNVCYLQTSGCQNEEIKAEVVFSKFIQDFRLENSNASKNLAFSRARELAFTKAVAKLGLEGWEIIGQPPVEFDAYISDNQGSFRIAQGNKEIKPNVYFKRQVQ